MTDRFRPFFALLLLSAHVWLAPFAYADPPDPLWMGGTFDDGDADDVVLLVMAMTSTVETPAVFEAPILVAVWCPPELELPVHGVTPLRARPIRAPPSA